MLEGLSVSDASTGTVTVRAAVLLTPLAVPAIWAVADVVTLKVCTEKAALVFPLGTVDAGRHQRHDRVTGSATATPPLGAAPTSITVPVAVVPPATEVGATESAASAEDDVIVNEAIKVTPPELAEMVTAPPEEVEVVTEKDAVVCPVSTVSVAGTVAAAVLLLASEITVPPAGGPLLRVIVPVDGLPPTTLVGDRLSPVSVPCGVAEASLELALPPLPLMAETT